MAARDEIHGGEFAEASSPGILDPMLVAQPVVEREAGSEVQSYGEGGEGGEIKDAHGAGNIILGSRVHAPVRDLIKAFSSGSPLCLPQGGGGMLACSSGASSSSSSSSSTTTSSTTTALPPVPVRASDSVWCAPQARHLVRSLSVQKPGKKMMEAPAAANLPPSKEPPEVQTSDPPKDPPGESPGEKAHIAVAGESSVADASLEKPTEGAPRKGATPEEVAARIVVATDQEPVKATTTTTTTVGRRREDDQWQLQQKEKQEEQEMVVADSEWDGGRLWIELAVYTSARRARTSDLFKEIGRGKAAKGLTLSMVRDFVASTLAPCNGFVFLGAARGDDDDSLARTFRAAMEMTNPGRGGGGEGAQEEEMERELSLGQLKQEVRQ